jgi:hypothetical protein
MANNNEFLFRQTRFFSTDARILPQDLQWAATLPGGTVEIDLEQQGATPIDLHYPVPVIPVTAQVPIVNSTSLEVPYITNIVQEITQDSQGGTFTVPDQSYVDFELQVTRA